MIDIGHIDRDQVGGRVEVDATGFDRPTVVLDLKAERCIADSAFVRGRLIGEVRNLGRTHDLPGRHRRSRQCQRTGDGNRGDHHREQAVGRCVERIREPKVGGGERVDTILQHLDRAVRPRGLAIRERIGHGDHEVLKGRQRSITCQNPQPVDVVRSRISRRFEVGCRDERQFARDGIDREQLRINVERPHRGGNRVGQRSPLGIDGRDGRREGDVFRHRQDPRRREYRRIIDVHHPDFKDLFKPSAARGL